MTSPRRGFASDNAATVHPAVLSAIAEVNEGHAFGYGHDPYSERVLARFSEVFGPDTQAFLVFNGTGANVCCLRAVCRPWHAVICTDSAHINVDEGGAPEWIAGTKLLTAPAGVEGKLSVDAAERLITRVGDEHAIQPRVISVTQSTELGTVYSLDELRDLASLAHARGLLLHVDGARLSNAAAALGCSLRETSFDLGVDLLSFGGTKNGLMFGEAIVVRDEAIAADLLYLRKQSMQLASKMRFLAAQFDALLRDELWLANASHANAMAARLAAAVGGLPGVRLTRPVQANAVFAVLPAEVREVLLQEYDFYEWDETSGEVRWVCSWDTTEADVDGFATALADQLSAATR